MYNFFFSNPKKVVMYVRKEMLNFFYFYFPKIIF